MQTALTQMLHRGPDAGGIHAAGQQATCGHRRLSIIDLAGSPQPMHSPDQRYTLVFNGEIYNYRELRPSLQDRWRFTSDGDTEVLLAGLVLEGEAFVARLEGMWAFALWNQATEQLLLGRDRMGKKPLFYASGPGHFSCASELPALKALNPSPWHEDLDSTADYLRYGYYLPGYSAYQEVREVLPGHLLRWQPSLQQTQSTPYWQLQAHKFQGSHQDAVVALRSALTNAVRRRLVADVEVGAFLSGGVDSTLVVGLATHLGGKSMQTFTIGFAEAAYDERTYAAQAAKLFGTRHLAEELSSFQPQTLETLLLSHVGQPFQDSSLLPTALVSQIAARHVKVALSGDGGDELFSGYQRYQARAILRWYTRLPGSLRNNLHKLLRLIPEPGTHHSRSLIKKAHLFCDIADRMAEETPYVAPLLFRHADRRQLAPDLADRGHIPPGLPEMNEPDDITRMMQADALVYLPQDILVKVDRSAMAASLETRAPFLDREVVELAFSLPPHWHRRGFTGKRMLQATFADLLPEWIWNRRKQGFAVPVHAWFRGAMGEHLLELARATPDSPIRLAYLEQLLQEHRQGRRDQGYRLWTLYAYLLWRQNQQR